MAGRKKIVFDNQAVMDFLWQFAELGQPLTVAIPGWVNDCVVGACRYGGNRASSPNAILFALSQLKELSTENVDSYVNRKVIALGEKPYGPAHTYSFFMRLRMASKAIQFHYERIHGAPLIPHTL